MEHFFSLFMSYQIRNRWADKSLKKIMLQSINHESCGYEFFCI